MVQSISPPFRPHYPWLAGEELVADELNAAIANAGHGMRITDWIPGGQPDGVTDLSLYFQEALDAAADADPANRVAAPGLSPLVVPANPLPYTIGASLIIPSHSHIIIESGATIMLLANTNTSMLKLPDMGTGILIELFGTLDGNGLNQAPPAGVTSGAIDGVVPTGTRGCTVSHSAIRGGKTGLITNTYHWSINLRGATDVEVSDLAMTNCAMFGGSPGFSGFRNYTNNLPSAVIASGNYVAATGVVTLTTIAPHFFVPGEEFATAGVPGTYDMTGTGGFASAQGMALTAGAGTSGSTIVYQVPPGGTDGTITGGSLTNWATQITPTIVSGTYTAGVPASPGIALSHSIVTLTTSAPHHLTYGQTITVNATAGTAATIARGVFVLLDGSTGTTLRYIAPDGGLNGGTITAGTIGVSTKCYDSGFNNCYADNNNDIGFVIYGGGINCYIRNCEQSHCLGALGIFSDANFGRSIGCEISGNYVHDNYGSGLTIAAAVNTSAVKHLNTRIFNNYVTRNAKGGISLAQCDGVDVSNNRTYANSVNPTNIAGITGEVIVGNFSNRVRITNNAIRDPVQTSAAVVQIAASGSSYNNTTGAVSLITATAHNMAHLALFKVTGTPSGLLDGIWQAQTGPGGTTLNYNTAAGLGAISITGGQVVPTGFGIMIDHPEQCLIADNTIGDYQLAPSMLAAIGGTWGVNGLSVGNYYGPRINTTGNFPADMSDYAFGAGVQGISYDAVTGNSCRTTPGLPSAGLTNFPPDGLTIGRNYSNLSSGPRSEIDFFCGAGNSGSGGFDFIKVIALAGGGTNNYNSTTAAITLTTNVAHGIPVGRVFTLSGAGGFDSLGTVTAGRDLLKVNGSWIATAGTAGTTLNFTLMAGASPNSGLDIVSITQARINATTTDGGVIDTSAGTGGVLFSVDGHGKVTLGSLPVSAVNDAAAATAGVPVGGIYRSGSALQVRTV